MLHFLIFDFQDSKLLVAVTDLIRENAQNFASSTPLLSGDGSDERDSKNVMYLFDWVEIADR